MKKVVLTLVFFTLIVAKAQQLQRPKLVVGIVADQMRWDYLYRYYARYGNDGFKRLLREGFSCENTFIPYTPTVTAAGHTCIYTGSVPSLHGIMGNSWYDRQKKKTVYCTDDSTVRGVGSNSAVGRMSPRNLWSNTITDELRMATNFTNKTISIALKDRGCILPGGHTANAAYWFDNATGGFISSTYYLDALPAWVRRFNERRLPDSFVARDWNTLHPINTYIQSSADSLAYETDFPGGGKTFPHRVGAASTAKNERFWFMPFANTFTLAMAQAAVAGENLGKGKDPDFLAVSLSSTDVIGHTFGPNSVEIEDTYLRLDSDLAAFLKFLDAQVGKGQYLLFLTSDHSAAHIPAWSREHKIPAGVSTASDVQKLLNETLARQYGISNGIEHVVNNQVFLDDSVLLRAKADRADVKRLIVQTLLTIPNIAKAVDLEDMPVGLLPQQVQMMVTNGYNQKLSGDIQYIHKPQWFEGKPTGTSHNSWNPYDAHIPLVWFGWNIRPGRTAREVYMTDIAATLAFLLHIQMPNACIGKVITEVSK